MAPVSDSDLYQPDDDDILVHHFDDRHDDAYFSVGSGFGAGRPHFYVRLDENGGERCWWIDPEQAEALGRRLSDYGAECHRLMAEEELRQARWRDEHPDRS
jgi:hypothetical protein